MSSRTYDAFPHDLLQNAGMTVGERIRRARIRAGFKSHAALAKPCGVSRVTVTNWENNVHTPEGKNLKKLAEVLRVSEVYILLGVDGGQVSVEHNDTPETRIPVVDYVVAGRWSEVADPYATGGGHGEIGVNYTISRRAFALEIRGRSMEPDFREGDFVVIDPDLSPQPGDYVVAKLDQDESATFKKYRERGVADDGSRQIELLPLNPDFPPLRLDRNSPGQIVGVMVEHRRMFRRRAR